MSFKVKARIFVFLLGLDLTTLAGCMKGIGTNNAGPSQSPNDAGPSQSPKLEDEIEQLQWSNMEKYRPKLEKGHLIKSLFFLTTQFFTPYLL